MNGIELNIDDNEDIICVGAGALDADMYECGGWFWSNTCYGQDVLDAWNGTGNFGFHEINILHWGGKLVFEGDELDTNQMDVRIEIEYDRVIRLESGSDGVRTRDCPLRAGCSTD